MGSDRSKGAMVVRRDGRWRLVLLGDRAKSCSLDSSDLPSFIGEHNLRGADVIVAVDAETAYLVSLPVSDESSLGSEDAIAFAIESELPLDAESVVVASHRLQDRLICNVIEVQPVWQCIDLLEQAGLRVQHVVVESFLWLQFCVQDEPVSDGVILYSNPSQSSAEVTELKQRMPVAWSRCRDEASEIEREIAMMTNAGWANGDGESSRLPSTDWESELAQACESLLSGTMTPWFELRRGRLASHDPLRPIRSSVVQFAIAVAAMLFVFIASLAWKTMQLNSIGRSAEDSIRDSFRESFPGQRVPTAIVKRVRSEHQKAIGQRSVSGTVERPVDAYPVLSNLISALPEELSFQVRTIRIQDGELQLDVDLGSLDAAAQMTRKVCKKK